MGFLEGTKHVKPYCWQLFALSEHVQSTKRLTTRDCVTTQLERSGRVNISAFTNRAGKLAAVSCHQGRLGRATTAEVCLPLLANQ